MTKTIYLLPAEKKLIAKAPKALLEGYDIKAETLTFKDTNEKMIARIHLLEFEDAKKFAEFFEAILASQSQEELLSRSKKLDFSSLSGKDLGELLFALGPTVVGTLIQGQLQSLDTKEAVGAAAALSLVRHELLASMQPSHVS